MQLIETSVVGVRSAVVTMQRPGTELRIVLFPMLHMGTAAFYRQVTERLSSCQVVVVEGIRGRSVMTGALTTAYRTPARSKRLGLVVQDIDYAKLVTAGVELLTPDMTGEQVDHGFQTVPWPHRIGVVALVPVMAVGLRLFGTRRMFGGYLETGDLPTPADEDVLDMSEAMTKLLVHDRDKLLITALGSLIRARADEAIAVGVVYGAGHMPAVVRALASVGFKPRTAEWLTAFAYD
ncbi:MAG TPA: hypothetical protein VHJ18_21440 [Streptosporangiaceae bacterium]|nr:hypothetical protein [Streptosporangiaceae bacterium]